MSRTARYKIRRLIRLLAVAVVFFLILFFFVFYYAPSAIALRRMFAKTLAGSEHHDAVRQIYTDIIAFDPEREESYLEIAGYEEQWMDQGHRKAWEWLKEGVDECGKTGSLIRMMTKLSPEITDPYLEQNDYRGAVLFMKEALRYGVAEEVLFGRFVSAYEMELSSFFSHEKYEELIERYESLKRSYRDEEVLRRYYLDAFPLLLRKLIREKDPEAAVGLCESFPEELKSSEEFRVLSIEAYLLLAKEAIAAGDTQAALSAVSVALVLDPENAVGRVLYLQLTGTDEMSVPPVDTILADGMLTLSMNAGAFVFSTPLTVSAPLTIDLSGLSTDTPVLEYSLEAEAEALGETQSFTLADRLIGNGDEDAVRELKEAYSLLFAGGVPESDAVEIDGIPCMVYNYTVEQGDLSGISDALLHVFGAESEEQELLLQALPLVRARITRYVSCENKDPVRSEVNLDDTDFALLLMPLLEGELPEGTTLSSDTASLTLDFGEIRRNEEENR